MILVVVQALDDSLPLAQLHGLFIVGVSRVRHRRVSEVSNVFGDAWALLA